MRIFASPTEATPHTKARANPTCFEPGVASSKVTFGVTSKFEGIKVITTNLSIPNGNPFLGKRITHGIIHILMKQMAMRSNINTKGNRRSLTHNILKVGNAIGINKLLGIIPD